MGARMKYMGSKRLIAREILPIILEGRKPGQWFVEPFVGGGNLIDQVEAWTPEGTNGSPRMGSDVNKYVIALLIAARDGWVPPDEVSEAQYKQIKDDPDSVPMYLAAFVMFCCSFSSNWGAGYGREKRADGQMHGVADVSHRTILRQAPKWAGTHFVCSDYLNCPVPKDAIVYCDPPYAGRTAYKTDSSPESTCYRKFDHERFWEWCDNLVLKRGHKVFVSEYTAPPHWTHVWEKVVNNNIDRNSPFQRQHDKSKTGTEKLFVHRATLDQGACVE